MAWINFDWFQWTESFAFAKASSSIGLAISRLIAKSLLDIEGGTTSRPGHELRPR